MKVLIVDDEINILNGLNRFLIDKKYPIDEIRLQHDSVEALELAREFKPDITITDISMARMDGFEMVEKMRAFLPDMHVIIISCHDEIMHLKRAFKLNAIDYVFKPVDTAELHAVMEKAIRMCSARIGENANFTRNGIHHKMEDYFENFLISGGDNLEGREDNFKKIRMRINGEPRMTVIVVSLSNIAFDVSRCADYAHMLNSKMQSRGVHFALPVRGDIAILVETEGELEDRANWTKMVAEEALAILKNETGISACAANGGFYSWIRGVSFAYKKAVDLIANKDMEQKYIGIETVNDYSSGQIRSIESQHIDTIVHAICMGDTTKAKETLSEINNRLQKEYERYGGDALLNTYIETTYLIHNVSRKLYELSGNHMKNITLKDIPIERLKTCREVMDSTVEIFMDLSDQYHAESNRAQKVVDMVKLMIEEEYANSEFNVQYIARKIGVGANYLSALFKSYTGNGLNETITMKRIKQAKELMLQKKLHLYEISKMVGLEDQNYFARIFKKYCGVRPTEYRERILQGREI